MRKNLNQPIPVVLMDQYISPTIDRTQAREIEPRDRRRRLVLALTVAINTCLWVALFAAVITTS